jgi:hypothetical protein
VIAEFFQVHPAHRSAEADCEISTTLIKMITVRARFVSGAQGGCPEGTETKVL